jgi:predicted RNA-binding Zn-ribbon protein involved in translation (DUF1610 family)
MDKLGVVIDESKVKEASKDKILPEGKVGVCPECGEFIAQFAFCRRCGTEPFEKRP